MCGPRCRVVGYGLNCGTPSFSGLCVGLEVWTTCGPRCRVVGYGLNCGTRSFSGLCVGLDVWTTL